MCKTTTKCEAVTLLKPAPKLSEIESWLPSVVFQKEMKRSMMYAARDVFCVVIGLVTLTYRDCLPRPVVPVVQFLTGFAMWCVFVIGHDCGHGTFSKDKFVNRVMGEVLHSVVLCTPFYAWFLSHREHHRHHNHVMKDYSHMWLVEEKQDEILAEYKGRARASSVNVTL